jgi:hypothetical protein
MSARVRKDKAGILADAKNLIWVLLPAIQRMPKIERIEGAPHEMKTAAFSIVANFTTAWNCPECRDEYIRRMFGDYGRLLAAFDIAIRQGLMTDSVKLGIAEYLERIEEGITKWHNALRSSQRQERKQVDEEACVSTNG